MSPENSKPEWFQLAEADAFPPQPKSRRIIRIMALAAPLFVLGAGFAFAQTQGNQAAVASTGTTTVSMGTPASTNPISVSSTPVANTPSPTTASTPVSHRIQVSQAATTLTAPKTSITIKKPGIKLPSGGGEDGGVRNSDDD